ncbi:sensor histidine kinase YesM [Vallitalea longa]|uniref:Sensor histidine kinase YesM n=1 Tax=Vallitalea longa TaxID=2936439 RepID=A0A9W5YAH4_9FIRM|nr:histidine kinase [Vallitalea longa]GKX28808.1 sensor histidine kinase YesM [Vallitalea longa]
MGKIHFRNSIFIKLCTAFFFVIIILFLIGYSVYFWGINKVRDEIIQNVCVTNQNFSYNLNNELKRIITLQYELTNDWDLTKLSFGIGDYNDYEESLIVLNVRDKISAIKTSSQLIDEIKVIVPAIDKAIGTNTIGEIMPESMELVKNYKDMENKQIIYYNNEILLISEHPQIYYKRELKPNFLIYATINSANIKKFLRNMSIYSESNGFICSESRKMIIGSNGNEDTQNKVKELIDRNKGRKIKLNTNYVRDTFTLNEKINGTKYIIVYSDTGVEDIRLVRYIPEKVAFGDLNIYSIIIWLFAVVAIIFIILFSKSLYNTIHEPLRKLVKAFDKIEHIESVVTIEHHRKDEFKYIYDSFNKMSYKLHNLIEQVYKQKILVQKSELKQLQAQINPHFLYNSFIMLKNRIEAEDIEFASEFCSELGSFFMFITRNKKEIVPLKNEVEHAVTYTKIQHARFSNRLTVKIDDLPKEYENILVPKIILQPILENAFEHTLENMEDGGILEMAYEVSNNYIDIIISDNGEIGDHKINQMISNLSRTDVEVTGMINIHKRLRLIYSDKFGLILSRSKYGGLKVTIRIPIENGGDR